MGYTHYWDLNPNHKHTNVKKLQTNVQKVLDEYKDILQYESDVQRPALCELSRDGGREIFIRFNGIDSDGHETFYFDSKDPDGGYCKTNRKDYDEPVTKVLTLLKVFYGQRLNLSSDGFSGIQPKDRYYGVGDIAIDTMLDGNWVSIRSWYKNLFPFGKPIQFKVIGTHGGINSERDPYFKVTLHNG